MYSSIAVYTDQYLVYNDLIEEHGQDDFDAIAIPTNQFGREDPGNDDEILIEIRYVRPGGGFVPNYVVAAKSNANGLNADEIFEYLKVRDIRVGPFVNHSYICNGNFQCINGKYDDVPDLRPSFI